MARNEATDDIKVRARRADAPAKGRKPAQAPAGQGGGKRQSTGRFKTGLIFSLAVVICTLASDISTAILCAALAVLCAYELFGLLRSDAKLPNEWIGVTAAALCPLVYFWLGMMGILLLVLVLVVGTAGWYVMYARARFTDVSATVFGALYTGMLLTSYVVIRTAVPGIWGGVLTVAVILSIWANDTMAYVWGSRLGRHRMAPRISPKKSWEGCIAGLVGSIVIWEILPFIPGVEIAAIPAAICAVVTGICSIIGDLVESRIKRAAGKKDSGTLLKGHGGFFDRCDAMILGGAAAAVCLMVCGVVPLF